MDRHAMQHLEHLDQVPNPEPEPEPGPNADVAAAAAVAAIMVQNQPTPPPKCQDDTTSPVLPEPQLAQFTTKPTQPIAMIFSDFYRGPRLPLSRLRLHTPQLPPHLTETPPEWGSDEYADLLSRDKSKQKDAVKRYLSDKIRSDWTFTWPPAQSQPADEKQPPELGQQDQAQSVGAVHEHKSPPNGKVFPHLPADQTIEPEQVEVESKVQGEDVDEDNDDGESVYSIVSEDPAHYRPRMEWTSDLSDDDDDDDDDDDGQEEEEDRAIAKHPSLRFDSPHCLRATAQDVVEAKRARRRRALREEMTWNEGLAHFEARRDAWTNARTVRVRSKPATTPPASPRSPRRLFFRRSISASGSPPAPTLAMTPHLGDGSPPISDTSSLGRDADKELRKQQSIDSTTSASTHAPRCCPVKTLLPIGQPLLPPHNPLRASISPAVYLSLYDKVILHNLQPACPINLLDMLRSCVAGWKRDGEWPPRSTVADPPAPTRKKKRASMNVSHEQSGGVARRMSFGLLGRDHHELSGTSKGIRRSLQRALGIGVMES